jgi:hypothetical protein
MAVASNRPQTLVEARADLEPFHEELCACILRAHARYLADHGDVRYLQTKRSQASNVHDYMVDEVKQLCESRGGGRLSYTLKNNLFLLHVDGRYSVKLKKLDHHLRTSNIPTQLVMDFLSQKQLELVGVEAPTNLQLGYQQDLTGTGRPRVWVTCPDGSGFEWVWELNAPETDASTSVEPEPQVSETQRVRRRTDGEVDQLPGLSLAGDEFSKP